MHARIDAKHYWLEARLERREGWASDTCPFNLPAVRHTDSIVFHPKVTFLVGENGAGKSTLIEALAVAWGFNAEGGSKNFNFSNRTSHSPLYRFIRPVRGVAGEERLFPESGELFNVATEIERLDEEPGGQRVVDAFGGKSPHEQSHGESFFALMEHRFRGKGLYILDEPEAALSSQRQLAFLARMHKLVGDASQFIIATHSPIILGYPHALIYHVSPLGLAKIDYEELEHVRVTRSFLNHRDDTLKTLRSTNE